MQSVKGGQCNNAGRGGWRIQVERSTGFVCLSPEQSRQAWERNEQRAVMMRYEAAKVEELPPLRCAWDFGGNSVAAVY